MFGNGSVLDTNRKPEYWLARAKQRVSDAKEELAAAEREFIKWAEVVAEKSARNHLR